MATKPPPIIQLDRTPTYEEEVRDFLSEPAYKGTKPFDEDGAKGRIDSIARRLAIVWSFFLIYLILAQGFTSGWQVDLEVRGYKISFFLVRPFHLDSADFIAVVTTTTAAVFGFLVIVTNHLFFRRDRVER